MKFAWWIYASLLSFILFATACSPSEGYEELPSGSKWRLLAFGEQEISLDSAEIVYLNYSIIRTRTGDTIANDVFKSYDVGKDELWQLLRNQFVGDSIGFVSVTRDFLHPGQLRYDELRYNIALKKILTKRELETQRVQEQQLFEALLESDSLKAYYEAHNGVWIRQTQITLGGPIVEEGKELVLQYRGYGFDGKLYDDTWVRNEPLRFMMGNEHQVIPGIEAVLEGMAKGESARIIMPSELAFGSRGSGSGYVKPYTPMVYEIEVIDVAY